jgi:anti-sigma factor RsiW
MNCPLHTRENAEQLFNYCSRRLDPQTAAVLERHIAVCPECRQFAENQRAVWDALDAWEAAPVSAGFDRRLYQRIANEQPWWRRIVCPLTQHWNVAASAAGVCVLLMAGVLLNHPVTTPEVAKDAPQVEQVQAEQVEHALDAMDMLAEFNRDVKDGSNAKM